MSSPKLRRSRARSSGLLDKYGALLTLPEAGHALGLHPRSVKRLADRGLLRLVKLHGGPCAPVRVRRDELERYLASLDGVAN